MVEIIIKKKMTQTKSLARDGRKKKGTDERLFKVARKICMRTRVDEGPLNDGTSVGLM